MNTKDLLRVEGILFKGFGHIPKFIMLDTDLTIEAKGIYAYFCSFAGSGNSAFPKLSNILYHLQISEKTYYKYYGELVKFNYITPIQRNIKGRFSVNDYYINETPDEELVESKPFSKNSDTEKSIDNPSSLPFSKNSDTQKPYTQKPYTQKSDTQNSDTNNTNSFNTNSIYYNQSINHTLLNKVEKNDRLIEKYSLDYIKEMLETEVYAMDRHDNLYGELTNLVYDVVNETRDTIKINGNLLPTEVVRSRFLKLTPGNLLYVIEVFKKQTTKVNNIRQYLITALYNSFSTLDSYYTNAVNHDLYGA